ncbi:GNAT family N-acetyltransferase [Fundidesulfovibrio agrisoli]|uniref:GNAT family N-acetyltransferase n=1 Tax=Fundidesulfovibrio agrisoli TaxID=2922717 RepID=UPI001FACF886
MKTAVVLSAGLGTRLRPLTDTCPKPMVPVAGVPLLERTVRHLAAHGFTRICVNLHHLSHVVREAFGDGSALGVRMAYSEEPELLGTAGALNAFRVHLHDPFLVWYGDVLSDFDVTAMKAFHQRSRGMATVGLYRVDNPTQCGLVDMDATGRIGRFVEKPPVAFTDLANAGVYICEPEVLGFVPATGFSDFGHDVFPAMLAAGAPLYGYAIEAPLIDIGSPEKLARANAMLAKAPDPAPACLALQEFDSEAFRQDYYRVTRQDYPALARQLARLREGGKPFLADAKLPAADIEGAKALMRLGFLKVCAQVTFSRDLTGVAAVASGEPAGASELPEDELDAHAANFPFSRFGLDPNVTLEERVRHQRKWIANTMRSAEVLKFMEPGGFVSFRKRGEAVAIDLVSVLPRARGRGSLLLGRLAGWAAGQGFKRIDVTTEAENLTACLFYEKNGYRLSGAAAAFHMRRGVEE